MSEKLYTNARQSNHIFASILNISVMDPLELYLNKWQLAFSISWMYQPKDQILHMCLAGCVFWFDLIWRVFCACMFLDVIFLHVFVWSETLLPNYVICQHSLILLLITVLCKRPQSSVEKSCSNENAKVPVLSCEYTAMLFLPKNFS